jgi:hypothetical protein
METPYKVPGGDAARPLAGEGIQTLDPNDKWRRPDGSREPDAPVDPKILAAFLGGVAATEKKIAETVASGKTPIRELDAEGTVNTYTPQNPEEEAAVLAKVAAFLDPKLRGPIGWMVVRNKVFVMRIPVQQEMIDVTAITGQRIGEDLTQAQFIYSIIGELRKASYGWLPANAPDAQLLRAHISDPEQWPELRKIDWMASRDPYIIEAEIMPLWKAYLEWRMTVVPTRDEIDFYLAAQR